MLVPAFVLSQSPANVATAARPYPFRRSADLDGFFVLRSKAMAAAFSRGAAFSRT